MTQESLTLVSTTCIVSSGVSLLAGWYFIRGGSMERHRAAMLAATAFAGLFLVFYVTRWSLYGSKPFGGSGIWRTLYLANLIPHVILATLGLSAILVSSTTLFMVIKFAGAAYLVWLGASTLLRHDVPPCVVLGAPKVPWQTLYTRGVAIQFMNPGIILFIVALLPQFVDPNSGSATLQILVLGITFIVIELITESLYAVGSGGVARWLGRHPNANLQCGRLTGVKPQVVAVLAHDRGFGAAAMVRRGAPACTRRPHAIRIEPNMKL